MTSARTFLKGFFIGLFIVVFVNLLAAHLLSDCGLPALLGADFCADDIARAGFPLVFFEQGGFAYQSGFNLPYLLIDSLTNFIFAVLCGFITSWVSKLRSKN
jgi:ABC-type thiamin/hydroxymethylpyrimidine transport system permease subunit